jgi:hypothetical protein
LSRPAGEIAERQSRPVNVTQSGRCICTGMLQGDEQHEARERECSGRNAKA